MTTKETTKTDTISANKVGTTVTPEEKEIITKAKREVAIQKKKDAAAGLNVMATKRDLENIMFWGYAVSVTAPADMINFGQLQPSTFKKAARLAKTMRVEWDKADIK